MSHTTDDMIFQWDPDVPLVVDENIELPQLALVKNNTADCTQVYSTGNITLKKCVYSLLIKTIWNVIMLCYKFLDSTWKLLSVVSYQQFVL